MPLNYIETSLYLYQVILMAYHRLDTNRLEKEFNSHKLIQQVIYIEVCNKNSATIKEIR